MTKRGPFDSLSEESESAPIPIKVADRSLVDLLGKDSSPKSRSEDSDSELIPLNGVGESGAVPIRESDGMTVGIRPT